MIVDTITIYFLLGVLIILTSELFLQLKEENNLKLNTFERMVLIIIWPYILYLVKKEFDIED